MGLPRFFGMALPVTFLLLLLVSPFLLQFHNAGVAGLPLASPPWGPSPGSLTPLHLSPQHLSPQDLSPQHLSPLYLSPGRRTFEAQQVYRKARAYTRNQNHSYTRRAGAFPYFEWH